MNIGIFILPCGFHRWGGYWRCENIVTHQKSMYGNARYAFLEMFSLQSYNVNFIRQNLSPKINIFL